jgi:hydroxymethylbilane synthase
MSRVLRVATRRGALALVQTRGVLASLKAHDPDLQIEIKEITSEGDRDRRTLLWQLKDAGFFTSRLEEVLLAGEADFAVHSFKDLPTRAREGLTVAAVCDRRFPEDCIVARDAADSLEKLPPAARLGTSSLRRIAQLGHLRPDLRPEPIRGNVQTRLDKLAGEALDAVVLARAGLERLDLAGRISFAFDPEQFVPAAAQGALAIQARSDDAETNKILKSIDDDGARILTTAERQVLITMKCGCHAPVGAHARRQGDDVALTAFVADRSGATYLKRQVTGPAAEAEALGRQVAEQLLAAGGKDILAELEKERNQGDKDS